MAKIRALNEESTSVESEDESNRKISKEAQEELANLKYHEALKELGQGNMEKAVRLLEELLEEPGLQLQNCCDDSKQSTQLQQKLQLGSVKILGEAYRMMKPCNLARSRAMYEMAVYLEPEDKFHVWYRLSKVCLEMGDLYSAHNAYAYTLHLRPTCWGCIENLVTISYAINDYIGCLQYCAVGLKKDPNFVKGYVFRDLVYETIPELKYTAKSQIKDANTLNESKMEFDISWKTQFMDELKKVKESAENRLNSLEMDIDSPTPKINFNLKSFSLVEIVKELLVAYEGNIDSQDFHREVDLSWTVEDSAMETEEIPSGEKTEQSQGGDESESQSEIIRSRSLSDEKDTETAVVSNIDGASEQQEVLSEENKNVENNSENSQPTEVNGPAGDGEVGGGKKKGRGNVKWWQMAGKRRSQRVRGHLIPVSPDKTKKESSFADQLKNLIPATLLGEDGTTCEKEVIIRSPEKHRWQKKKMVNYFGTKEEEMHARELLVRLRKVSLPTMIVRSTLFLTSVLKFGWTSELRDLFLVLYKYYRSHVNFPEIVEDSHEETLFAEALTSLTFLEVALEKYKTEINCGDKARLAQISKEVYFLEDLTASTHSAPQEIKLRSNWMSVKRLLDLASALNDPEPNVIATELLQDMEAELRQRPLTIWTATEMSNCICFESVSEKSTGITKLRNSQVITDLYETQKYEPLIKVLQNSINFCEVEKRDLIDIYFYTVALFRTENLDCICQCVNLVNQAMKFQDTNVLAKALILLDEIWEKLKTKFTLQDQKLVVESLIKVLVSCEAKPPPQECTLCIPWCLLHGIAYALERDEPALYLEEETIPNSILLLQMAHECMSRTEKCCVDNGRLMLYTMRAILEVKKKEEYFAFDETRSCMEQAIFCLYSHPSKKSKAKNLKDHNSAGILLTWEMCPLLYQYYCPDELPEFDSYGSIGADVESLFQKFLEIMADDLNPVERKEKIQSGIDNCVNLKNFETCASFPADLQDIYYLIGDYYFKSKEWAKAVTFYTWDLAVVPSRFDSWAAIGLCLGESINTKLNTADNIDFKELLKEAQSTSYCFQNALKFDPVNIKLRIEFGSFVYAMHAYCSRLLKLQATVVDMELFKVIEEAKKDFLKSAFKCFEPIEPDANSQEKDEDEKDEEEIWIHHYMLGKIKEKNEKVLRNDRPQDFLKEYELAGKLLHEQGAPYPSKMNYYSPPELAIEALEIYYRIHASILSHLEHTEYSLEAEKLYLEFIRRQLNSPFVKSKQMKGDEAKKGKKAADDSKKEMAEVTAVMKELLDKTEKLVETNPITTPSSGNSGSSSTSTDDDSTTDSAKSASGGADSKPMSCFSLSAFQKRLKEKELQEEKIASAKEASKIQLNLAVSSEKLENKVENLYEGLDLEKNIFYESFKDVKYGAVVSLCLKAMEECISRYPSHYKSYYRIGNAYMVFLKDAKKAREYLMGSQILSQRKITGLFGERKVNNFFNGIWRNPIDDIDRPGSFSYHMNKSMQLLLDVLSNLKDHQLLVELVVNLSKVPDNEKKYLSNPDREMFFLQAQNCCVNSIARKITEPNVNFQELGIEAYETYTKLQKIQSQKGQRVLQSLHEIYKAHLESQGIVDEVPTQDQALRYFAFHHINLRANRAGTKAASGNNGDQQRAGGGEPGTRKRGRRTARIASQEAVQPTTPTSQDIDMFNVVSAAFQSNNFLDMSPLSAAYLATVPSISSMYPKMNLGAVQSAINPMFNDVESISGIAKNHPMFASHFHDSNRKISKGATNMSQSSSRVSADTVVTTSNSVPNVALSLPKKLSNKAKASASMSSLPSTSSNKSVDQPSQLQGSRKQESAKTPVDKYPPMPPLHPIRINTSPFKAQATALEQPPSFKFTKQKTPPVATVSETIPRKNPPAAHSHAAPKKRKSTDEGGAMPLVIDLTVKTPEKESSATQPARAKPPDRNTEQLNKSTMPQLTPRNLTPSTSESPSFTSYPLPPKKKLQMMYRMPSISPEQHQPPPPPQQPSPGTNNTDNVEVIFLD